MNIMVRFKRACAVLAAGATLAGGLALLPTVAQAVESKNVQTKAAPYTITFISDLTSTTGETRQTDSTGKLDPESLPKAVLPDYMKDSQTEEKPWTADGWTYSAMGFDKVDFSQPFTADTTVYAKWDQPNIIYFNSQDPRDDSSELVQQSLTTKEGHKLAELPKDPPSYPGYTFDGWFSAENGKAFDPTATFSEDTNFTARYTKVTTPNQPDEPGQTTPNEPNKPGQTAPVDNNTKQPAKDNNKAPAKDPAKKDAKNNKNNNNLAKTGADATAPLAIAAGLCLAAGITLGLRRKLAL